MTSASLASKREVRDHVKQALQLLVNDGTIETDELKSVVKFTGDAVSQFPADSCAVEETALTELLRVLQEASAASDVLTKVQQRLTECQQAKGTSQRDAEEAQTASVGVASAAGGDATTVGDTVGETKAFTFGALRARLAKKKEELQAAASSRPDTAAIPATANTTAPTTANASINTSVAPSESAKERSPEASAGVSPTLQTSTARDTPPPPLADLAKGDSASEASKSQKPQQQGGGEGTTPALKKRATVVLTASPLVEEDLYAEFIGRGRGRARGVDAARGGATAFRAGGYRGGAGGRGGSYPGPPPAPYARGGYRGGREGDGAPPYHPNGSYSPFPLRGGYAYPGPPRGGYPQHLRGNGGFRPY